MEAGSTGIHQQMRARICELAHSQK